MASVGILGGNSNETAHILSLLCQEKGQKAIVGYYKITENNVIPIVSIDENVLKHPMVFILQEATNCALNGDSYLIVNADSPVVANPTAKGVITYGFNGKSSVTLSSVADDAVQVCIQRGFKSLNGCEYEPQEFKASFPAHSDPLNVLGAVTACAVLN